jgi:hypothetical protein
MTGPTPAEIARESRARQGLPAKVDDPVALDRLATLLATPAPASAASHAAPEETDGDIARGAALGASGEPTRGAVVGEVHAIADERIPAAAPRRRSTKKTPRLATAGPSNNRGQRTAAGEQ